MSDFSFNDWARINAAGAGAVDSVNAGIDRGRTDQAYNKAQDALKRVRANPADQQALTDLAVYDPAAATAYQKASEAGRAQQVRSRTADLIRATPITGQSNPSTLSSLATQAPVDQASQAQAPQALPALTPAPTALAPVQAPSMLAGMANGQAPVQAPMPSAVSQPIQAPQGQPQAPEAASAPISLADTNHPALQQAGAAVMSGQMSANDAFARLAQVADPKEINDALSAMSSMDKVRLDRIAESNGAMAVAAQTALSIPDDAQHTARRAFVASQAQALAQHGVTPNHINAVDLSDAGLHGIVGQAIGVAGLITQANKERDDNRLDATLTETVRHNQATEGKPAISPDGTIIDPKTGAVLYSPNGGSTGGTGGSTGGASIGDQNNNAGNVRNSPFAQRQPGYVGVGAGGFAKFDTAQHGIAAQETLLRNNYQIGNGATINSIINRYAPAGENSSASQVNYKAAVAKALGISQNTPLTPAQVPQLASAMRAFETGSRTTTVPQGSPTHAPSDPTIDSLARQYNATGKSALPPGNGAVAFAYRKRIMDRATELQVENGQNGTDVANSQADRKNDNATLRTMQTTRDQIATAVTTAHANGQRYLETARNLPYQTGYKPLNALTNTALGVAGNAEMKAHHAAASTFAAEIAKVLTSTTGVGGVLSDSARQEQLGILDSDSPYAAKAAAVDILEKDARARLTAYDRGIAARSYARDHGHNPVHVNSPEEAARLPSGTAFVGHDGVTRIRS